VSNQETTASIQAELTAYVAARDALLSGNVKSYAIGGRSLVYNDLGEIGDTINRLRARLFQRSGQTQTSPVFLLSRG